MRSRSRPWLSFLPWFAPILFLAIFFLYPLAHILWVGLNPVSVQSIVRTSLGHVSYVFLFTFYQACLSTLLTLTLGLPVAFLFSHYEFYGKSFLRTLTTIPFMLPTVVVAAGFTALLGPRGWVNIALMHLFGLETAPLVFTGTLGAILVAHVFYNTSIVIRIVGNALSQLDPRLEQAARTLGANRARVFWRVTLALLRPSILAAALLVFIFDFTSFGVILLLGGPRFSTLEVEIYTQAVSYFNIPLAALLSLIQLLCTLVFSVLYSRLVIHTVVSVNPRANPTVRPRSLPQRLIVTIFCILLFVFYALPLSSLPLRSITRLEADQGQRGQIHYGLTGDYYRELFVNRNDSVFYVPPFEALGNSLGYAALTVILSLALGFPAAAVLAHPGHLERLLDPFLMLPLGASAVTLGLGLIITFNKPLFASNFQLISSPLLVPIAHTIIALPFVIRSLQPALASIPERLRQAAAVLGASPPRVWFIVDWPIVSRATLSAAVFAFTISLGEFGASSLVVRPEYPTLPIAIARFLSQPGGLNYGQAMAMATILMVVCGMGIMFIEKLRLPGAREF
ncbi:MAG: iron ABC transporter permease [Anaerolineales bacterium]|jgi:thiamine transport system permease protein